MHWHTGIPEGIAKCRGPINGVQLSVLLYRFFNNLYGPPITNLKEMDHTDAYIGCSDLSMHTGTAEGVCRSRCIGIPAVAWCLRQETLVGVGRIAKCRGPINGVQLSVLLYPSSFLSYPGPSSQMKNTGHVVFSLLFLSYPPRYKDQNQQKQPLIIMRGIWPGGSGRAQFL
jgi:hypothetical protein